MTIGAVAWPRANVGLNISQVVYQMRAGRATGARPKYPRHDRHGPFVD